MTWGRRMIWRQENRRKSSSWKRSGRSGTGSWFGPCGARTQRRVPSKRVIDPGLRGDTMSRIASALFLSVLLTSPAAAERPNIVLFLADDLSWSDCSPLGSKEVRTPNMARLARDGMTFTHAFVASPSCAPSRAALLTGLDPMRNGAMLNHSRPRPEVKKWPAYFHELGYEVVSFGKTAHYAQVTGYDFDHAGHYGYHQDDCVEAAVAWLGRREGGRPLCLLVGTNWPHVP